LPPSFESGGSPASAPDVARDLVELVGGDEDLVTALVGELEVVAGHARHRARVEAREEGDPVILVDNRVAGA
jgi:hypothetical protein